MLTIGIVLLVVFVLAFVIPTVRDFMRVRALGSLVEFFGGKKDDYAPKSRIVQAFGKLKAKFSPAEKTNAKRPLFCEGQKVRFPSWKSGMGPLIWGTVIKSKKTEAAIHPDGTRPRTRVKRKIDVLKKFNFPKGSAIGELIPIETGLRDAAMNARG